MSSKSRITSLVVFCMVLGVLAATWPAGYLSHINLQLWSRMQARGRAFLRPNNDAQHLTSARMLQTASRQLAQRSMQHVELAGQLTDPGAPAEQHTAVGTVKTHALKGRDLESREGEAELLLAGGQEHGQTGHGQQHSMLRQLAALEPARTTSMSELTVERRCALTIGSWCRNYYNQVPVPRKPAPRGNLACPNDCSGVGNCHHGLGVCFCPVGFQGEDCSLPKKRPCLSMGPNKRDLNYSGPPQGGASWIHTRCPGICDDVTSQCYCPPETKYGRVMYDDPKPRGWNNPVAKEGRHLFYIWPDKDMFGNKAFHSTVTFDRVFGPDGWCNAEIPFGENSMYCTYDGWLGERCHIPVEHTCPQNQCSGHGDCYQGFCKCHQGYYGQDCSQLKAGAAEAPGDDTSIKPWIKHVTTPVPAAQEPQEGATRKRPFIYVYDLPSEFFTDIMQYRLDRHRCMYRVFSHHNNTDWVTSAYSVEPIVYESFLTSEHRTFDPEEADFFYVPALIACHHDIYKWHEWPSWPEKDVWGTRPLGAAFYARAVWQHLSQAYPYWNRSGGADHIWMWAHDEGACYTPKEIWPSIMLTHWGRLDFPHASHTGYGHDNYSAEYILERHAPEGWLKMTSKAHPCYDPKKDFVIPIHKPNHHFDRSQFMGAKPMPRDWLLYMRGDVGIHRAAGDPQCLYSRCIRQTVYNLSKEHNWREKHNIYIGPPNELPGAYGDHLSRSIFCLDAPGEGWSARFEDATLHGCIPVVVMDDVHEKFESHINVSAFSIRIKQKDLDKIPEILESISFDRIREMQANLALIWQRLRYNSVKFQIDGSKRLAEHNRIQSGGRFLPLEGRQYADIPDDDAFMTIIQWLYGRIPDIEQARKTVASQRR